jgi:hypothetical protein
MVSSDIERFKKAWRLARFLRGLQPGLTLRLTPPDLDGVDVPDLPLEQQRPEHLVEWLRLAMPFGCETHLDPATSDWLFVRPEVEVVLG